MYETTSKLSTVELVGWTAQRGPSSPKDGGSPADRSLSAPTPLPRTTTVSSASSPVEQSRHGECPDYKFPKPFDRDEYAVLTVPMSLSCVRYRSDKGR